MSDMWAYVYTGEKVEKKRVPIPKIRANDVLVKVEKVSVCGSDFHIFENDDWAQETVPPGMVIGHEGCGVVVEVGSEVTNVNVGDHIALGTHFSSPACEKAGTHVDDCKEYGIIGIHASKGKDTHTVGGCFSEYVALPAYAAYKVSEDTYNTLWCSLLEPAGNSWEIIRILKEKGLPQSIAIHGCGPHGLNLQLFARDAGIKTVVAFEVDPWRLKLAQEFGAAHHVINPQEVSEQELEKLIPGGFDVAVDMAGNVGVVNACKQQIRDEGLVILFGLPKEEAEIIDGKNFADIIFANEEITFEENDKTIHLRGITGRTHTTWLALIDAVEKSDLLKQKLAYPLKIIGSLHKLEQFLEKYPEHFLKIGMYAFSHEN